MVPAEERKPKQNKKPRHLKIILGRKFLSLNQSYCSKLYRYKLICILSLMDITGDIPGVHLDLMYVTAKQYYNPKPSSYSRLWHLHFFKLNNTKSICSHFNKLLKSSPLLFFRRLLLPFYITPYTIYIIVCIVILYFYHMAHLFLSAML